MLVRILHGMIRHTVLPGWDRAKLGVPISQFGLFGTMMLSTFVPGTQLRLLGYLTSAADVEAAIPTGVTSGTSAAPSQGVGVR